MRLKTTELIAGTTFRTTFASSGTTVTGAVSALYDASETLVDSKTAVDSGNGHWFGIHTVTTPGWYVNEWLATIAGNPYYYRQFVRLIKPEVD